ncbi:hypothetical protein [Flavobacterium sp.]|uniref:hypothetical protein n=2 Tax=unclassified Flavobacterium TaxID=196869 RepID=UPI00263A022D|nr:hypothetical protein [Flavobacterium sp.]
MRRDASAFTPFGVTAAGLTAFETSVNSFMNSVTDIEALADQVTATAAKDAKAEQLRVAIRAVMTRVEAKYGTASARYRKFGTSELSQQPDSDLLITGKRVVRVGTLGLTDLAANGLTAAMLAAITTLCNEFDALMLDAKLKAADRDVIQEDRVEAGNAIYTQLVSYTTTGRNIWETSDLAKYNDYVIYNTVSGEAEAPEEPANA